MLEFASVLWTYAFDAKANRVDIQFSLSGFFEERQERSSDSADTDTGTDTGAKVKDKHVNTFINMDDEYFRLDPISVYSPKCVSPLVVPSRDFSNYCTQFVSSFEGLSCRVVSCRVMSQPASQPGYFELVLSLDN